MQLTQISALLVPDRSTHPHPRIDRDLSSRSAPYRHAPRVSYTTFPPSRLRDIVLNWS